MAWKQKYCKKNCGQKQLSLPTDELHSPGKNIAIKYIKIMNKYFAIYLKQENLTQYLPIWVKAIKHKCQNQHRKIGAEKMSWQNIKKL